MEVINKNSMNFRPTAGDAYGNGWTIMWKYFVILLVVSIIYGIVSGPTVMFQINSNNDFNFDGFSWFMIPMAIFAIAFGIFISGPIGYSVNWVFLKAVRGEELDIKDMFAVFQRNYWNAVAANILVGLVVGIGFVMLIIPGIIFACRLAFVPYLIIDREMEVSEALTKSWEMTKGYGWHIFFMGFLAFWVVVLGLLALIFGVIISGIWIQTAFAVFYQSVVEEEGHFQDNPIIEEV